MGTFLVGYDLNKPGQDYADLFAEITSLGSWWHYLDSTWLVKSELSHIQVRDKLNAKLDANDRLLVIDVSADAAAWTGFDQSGSDWLKKNL